MYSKKPAFLRVLKICQLIRLGGRRLARGAGSFELPPSFEIENGGGVGGGQRAFQFFFNGFLLRLIRAVTVT